eukprot:CAMPEP_0206471898 /NCGR_PEP_ID=MMETSP0324_2-20121206/31852_1 /ASSEMBLY_ACC=CAM_ASM_000836 /TAXON_ID=2866 /ORGANISM="Crypthecodinium cohnii, Strain Seligo" /LENGTH=312 /DNA_ID=CAMNT_0053946341 /DNA_START=380 /DNA_END=1318 /DNA_ORIENTATION=+
MTPDDDKREQAFFDAQSTEEKTMRFLGGVNMPPALLRLLTHVNFGKDFAIVAVDRATDGLAGVARYVHQENDWRIAHAAVAVLKKYQRMGLAYYLLTCVFEAAKEAHINTLVADFLMVNHASKALFAKISETQGAESRLIERDGRVDTFHYILPQDESDAGDVPQHLESEKKAPKGPSFNVDQSRHPFSLWRRDLIFDTGLRVEIRPADADDRQRLDTFSEEVLKDEKNSQHLPPVLRSAPDFSRGFMLVALDTATDEIVAVAHFRKGIDDSSMHVITASGYKGMGIGEVLTNEVLRAAITDVTPGGQRSSM